MPRDERTFITVHDGMPEHPKVEGLSDAAFRLMVETWCWCSRNRTDGKIVATSWRKRGTARTRAELLAAGLVEAADDGVLVHDYTEHQRTAAEIDALSEKRREAGRKGGKAKANAKANASDGAKQTASKAVAETETEEEAKASSKPHKRGTRIPDDWKPSPEEIAWQRDNGIPDDLARRELPRFRDYWAAAPGAKGVKLDWPATWRNWLRTASENAATRERPRGPSHAELDRRVNDPLWAARQ